MELLKSIVEFQKVTDENGFEYPLHSHTSFEQCNFLDEIIGELVDPQISLEIGLAYGVSTLQIIHSFSTKNSGFKHIVVDPFQTSDWKNIGRLNILRSGLSNNVVFHEDYSDTILPKLYFQSTKIDFCYIDSTKVFDVLMVDLYYVSKMLKVGGIIVLDDCDFPGIRLLARFLLRHPSFAIFRGFNKDRSTWKGRVGSRIVHFLLKSIPFRNRFSARINVQSDEELGINYKCLSFTKVAEDSRGWDWNKFF